MTKPALTPWFPPDVLPVRDGVYEVDSLWFTIAYRRYSRKRWFYGSDTPDHAELIFQNKALREAVPRDQHYRWRGLAEEPK